LPINLVSLYSF